VDNFALDVVMPLVSSKYPKYFQILMVIQRKTVGWGKAGDYISLTQFMKGSGASRDTVVSALAFWDSKRIDHARIQTWVSGNGLF
jgi:hypothetical protein